MKNVKEMYVVPPLGGMVSLKRMRGFRLKAGLHALMLLGALLSVQGAERPNIILIMTDDQGYGQTGYYNHPVLKTPNLDAMANNGLRFDRFYAGAPVCSPTRASVLTGRSNDRTGVVDHGYHLQPEEKTLPAALKNVGYATGHFGKWHLNGLQGPGIPIIKEDLYGPTDVGFDTELSASNYFGLDPLMGRDGIAEKLEGDSSDIIVREALKFIKKATTENKPFFVTIWDGSPHSPFMADINDTADFKALDKKSALHYGELVAFDRSIGKLRQGLQELKIHQNTIVWFCSDNGGLPISEVKPSTTGPLRGSKGSMYEGGLRVPAIIEWPGKIKPRITNYPASTMDIFPTIVEVLGLPQDTMLEVIDGDSLVKIFDQDLKRRIKPIPFQWQKIPSKEIKPTVILDNEFKLLYQNDKYELYNVVQDIAEENNIIEQHPEVFRRLKQQMDIFKASVENSAQGKDYPSGKVVKPSTRIQWGKSPLYAPYVKEWIEKGYIKGMRDKKAGKGKKKK